MIKPQTLKGFRDFLPKEAKKRQYVIRQLAEVFESYGFEPLETPALEYEEVLLGKYGEEGDKLMYRFTDLGGRKVALRYDQTVPLARVVAQYENQLPMPFKRYQVQPVWRAENTQKGRFREFLQCDADIVGTDDPLSDAEIILLASECVKALGFSKYKIFINDRSVFAGLPKGSIQVLDKIKKIGKDAVCKELVEKKIVKDANDARKLIDRIENYVLPQRIKTIFGYLGKLDADYLNFEFSPTLARGLDYYTSTIFEVEIDGYTAGSVCGGGRYDNLIGLFAKKSYPAVGFAFGFDRLLEAMDTLKLYPRNISSVQVLVSVFSPQLKNRSLETAERLRKKGIKTELFLDEKTSLEKQLKYADTKGIPYVAIIGPNEKDQYEVNLKTMKTKTQQTMSIEDAIKLLKESL